MRKLAGLILLILSFAFLTGWRTYENAMIFGSPSAAGDRDIFAEIGAANNPGFRWNNASGYWTLSNNGTDFDRISTTGNVPAIFLTGTVNSGGGTIDFVHNFGTVFADQVVHLYSYNTGSGDSTLMTSGGSPDLDDFTIAASGGDPTNSITVTNNSGSNEDISVVITMGASPTFNNLTAATLSGDGSGVTNLDMDNATAGVLPVARGGTGTTSSTGSGGIVKEVSPTLTTPDLGTPSAATLTNATGLPIVTGTTGTLTIARGGTSTTTSTGTGSLVLAGSPALVSPNLGTPTTLILTNASSLPIITGTTGTLTVARGGTGSTVATGSGNVVLATNPTITNLQLQSGTGQMTFYQTSSTTANTSGCHVTSETVDCERLNNRVTCCVPSSQASCTSTAALTFGSHIPSGWEPSASRMYANRVRDGGGSNTGLVLVSDVGDIEFYKTIDAQSFDSGVVGGSYSSCYTWSIQ